MHHRIIALLLAVLAAPLALAAPPTKLELRPGDHIALVGNSFPDRMQHSGHFESLVHAKFPEHQLVFRNLAAAGDEVVLRHRSENFGSPDEWLTRVKADVILAFFGFNESFRGADGVPKFKSELDTWIKGTLAKNYSGKGGPRIVLFSPTANEKHQDPNYPDPTANNANLKLYAAAIQEVAQSNELLFVDAYAPSLQIFADAARQGVSLTVNGFLLTDAGDKALAPALFRGLFNEAPPAGTFERLRLAVNDKNAQWHARYRTVDGYNVYGGRSALAYQADKGGFISDRNAPAPYLSNFKVMQEEMAQRDVLTANRDKRVWTVARAGGFQADDNSLPPVDDSNLPPTTPVPSNKPGPNPDKSQVYIGGEEAISKMTVHSGMKVNLFASEKEFPELANPVQMAWDTKGRLWVAVWPSYPERTPDSKTGDSLLIFEDTNGDGKADKVINFINDLNCPTGFQFYKDGVLLMQAPDLWFLRDTDGDGKADWKERVLMGMDSADSHHTANAICLDPGGSIYLSDGVFHRTQVETAVGPVRNNDGGILRYEPRTGKFEVYVSYGFANPHGRVFDNWGNDFITDATGNNTYFGAAFSGFIDYPAKHGGMKEFWPRPSRPCPATGMLTSRHFPEEFQGNFLNANVISFQGIYRVKVSEEGSGLKGETLENLVSSTEPNFRPIAMATGPDGAFYFADWHQSIIGHMQHHLRDPNRDHLHGRIYRITYNGRELLKPVKIDGQPIEALLDLLKEPENQTRELAKIELGERDTQQVIAATKRWVAALNPNHANYQHQLMEGLWVHQWHNVVDIPFLDRMLASPEPRARAAAGRVLCYWRDRVPDSIGRFKKLAVDAHPRVRLEAIRGASFYRDADAAEMALLALKQPTDYYIDYCLKESLRQLEKYWRKAIADGRPIASDNPAGIDYLIRSVSTAELLKLPKTPGVLQAILSRADTSDNDRSLALASLALQRNSTRVNELLNVLESTGSGSLARLLPWEAPEELKAARSRVATLARSGKSPDLRMAGWAGLARADDSFDAIWTEAAKSPVTLAELIASIPLINDADFRTRAYDRVKPLLAAQLPPEIAAAANAKSAGIGRFVRIELPRRGTLTLAEVQVMSDGKNIAPKGKAKQSSTSNNGEANRAIDGKTSGDFGSGTQTHSQENESNPWWEVDLGSDYSIDNVVVWNRVEGELGKRLDGFSLSVLDGARREVFKKSGVPAPDSNVSVAIGGDPIGALRRAAIRAGVTMNRDYPAVFKALASLIQRGEQTVAAAQALRVIPRENDKWPKDAAGEAATGIVSWAQKVPAGERTSQDYISTVQFATDLAGLMPASEATRLRSQLKALRVAVFVVRTVREQMRFDTTRLVVEAGKPFEVIFENSDFMPHNLVFTKPGTRDALSAEAALMKPEDLDSSNRAYLPKSDAVIGATRLLDADQRETLKLTAPTTEGAYEIVCTYPGHSTLMRGTLVVTKDVDAYLQAHP